MSKFLKSDYKRQTSVLSGIPHVKPLEELNMMNSFLFGVATESIEGATLIASAIIRRSTGYSPKNLIIESEKQLKGLSLSTRGIRLDILATEKDSEKTLRIYDIEPNNYKIKNIPKRSRFYQSLMDSKLISPNTDFDALPDSLSIWILPYDPFGDGRMLYTIKNIVVENNHLEYNDGVTKLFLYTKGSKGGSKELKELLTFMENTVAENAVDEELENIQKIVANVKSRTDVKEHYMTLQEMIDYEKEDSYEIGRSEGIELGIRAIISTHKTQYSTCDGLSDLLTTHFHITKDKADEYISLYW